MQIPLLTFIGTALLSKLHPHDTNPMNNKNITKSTNSSFVLKVIFIAVLFMCVVEVSLASENVGATESTNILPVITYDFRGHFYVCNVTVQRIVSTPRLEIERSEPPISPRSAFLIAEKYAHSVVPDSASFKMREISLKQFVGNVWFYVVKLEPTTNPLAPNVGSSMEPIEVAVLMDGTVPDRTEEILDPKGEGYIPKK